MPPEWVKHHWQAFMNIDISGGTIGAVAGGELEGMGSFSEAAGGIFVDFAIGVICVPGILSGHSLSGATINGYRR